jgi:hypothetical protein
MSWAVMYEVSEAVHLQSPTPPKLRLLAVVFHTAARPSLAVYVLTDHTDPMSSTADHSQALCDWLVQWVSI